MAKPFLYFPPPAVAGRDLVGHGGLAQQPAPHAIAILAAWELYLNGSSKQGKFWKEKERKQEAMDLNLL